MLILPEISNSPTQDSDAFKRFALCLQIRLRVVIGGVEADMPESASNQSDVDAGRDKMYRDASPNRQCLEDALPYVHSRKGTNCSNLENSAAARHRLSRQFFERGPFMTIELKMLALSTVLGLVQIILTSHSASLQYGYKWAASARDEPTKPLEGIAGRLDRTLRNFAETFPLFAAAVLTVSIAGRHNWMTACGAQLYFWGRLLYIPLYAGGVPLVRSLVWNVATLGIILVLVSLL